MFRFRSPTFSRCPQHFSGCPQQLQYVPNMFRMSLTFSGCSQQFEAFTNIFKLSPTFTAFSNIFRFVPTFSDFQTCSDFIAPHGAVLGPVGPYKGSYLGSFFTFVGCPIFPPPLCQIVCKHVQCMALAAVASVPHHSTDRGLPSPARQALFIGFVQKSLCLLRHSLRTSNIPHLICAVWVLYSSVCSSLDRTNACPIVFLIPEVMLFQSFVKTCSSTQRLSM